QKGAAESRSRNDASGADYRLLDFGYFGFGGVAGGPVFNYPRKRDRVAAGFAGNEGRHRPLQRRRGQEPDSGGSGQRRVSSGPRDAGKGRATGGQQRQKNPLSP